MDSPSRPFSRLARDVLGVFKLRIGFMIMITALVGMVATPGPALGLAKIMVLALAILVASASAGAFNQYYEHDQDHLMARTRGRAFVTGALPHTPAWLVLIAVLFASLIASAMAVRYYNHAGFICGMPTHSPARGQWASQGAAYVRRAGLLYGWGLRQLVLVVPILAALLHPLAGPPAALVVIAVLVGFDRVVV